jgi:hypothetical protein
MPYASSEKRKKWVKTWSEQNSLISIRKCTKENLKDLDFVKFGDTYDTLINKLINFYKSKQANNNHTSLHRFNNSEIFDKQDDEDDEEEEIETKE